MHVCLCLNIFNVQQCVPKTAEGFFFMLLPGQTLAARAYLPLPAARSGRAAGGGGVLLLLLLEGRKRRRQRRWR